MRTINLLSVLVFTSPICTKEVSPIIREYEITIYQRKIKIQFSYIGFSNHIETIELKGEKITLNIALKTTAIEAEGIVVSGGYNSTQHENAVKIDLLKLNHAQIKNSPNFMEMITEIPGVDMISKGSGVSKPVIRGLSMNDVLVMNNGVRIENYQYSANHPLGIDNSAIDRIEIIKGPVSVLYGSDAIGGVINLIKEKPAPISSLLGDYNLQLFSNSLGISQNIGVKGTCKNIFGGFRFGHKSHAITTREINWCLIPALMRCRSKQMWDLPIKKERLNCFTTLTDKISD